MTRQRIGTFLAVFFLSTALLTFQVGLTRYLSAVLLYHYAFLVSSGAVLGLGLGSYLALSKSINFLQFSPLAALPFSLGLVSGIFFMGPYLPGLFPYVILGSIPFILAGMWFGRLYSMHPESSGSIYSADLAGAGLAALMVLSMLDQFGLFSLFAFALFLATLAWQAYTGISWRTVTATLLAMSLLGTGMIGGLEPLELGTPAFTQGPASPALRTGGEIVHSDWKSFARTDVIQNSIDPNQMIVSIDGGAFSWMWRFDGSLENSSWGRANIGYLPLGLGPREEVLIIGSGGGKDIVQALLGGHKNITAVEINGGSVEATRTFSQFSGSIYDQENVKTVIADGRSFVRSTTQKYDIVYLSLVMAQVSDVTGYALAENFIYTKEAFNEYFDLLEEGGYLSFVAHDESDMSKIIATAVDVLQGRGVPLAEIDRYFAVANPSAGHQAIHSPAIVVAPEPLGAGIIESFVSEAGRYGHQLYSVPGGTSGSILADLAQGELGFSDWLRESPWNIKPSTDNSPFFYNFGRGIPLVLSLLLIISLALSGWFTTRVKSVDRRSIYWFGALGVAFMLVEAPIIQSFVLFLGHPARGFTVVLASLLISAGLGSELGRRLHQRYGQKVFSRILFALPVIIALQAVFLPGVFAEFAGLSTSTKIIITWLALMPAGLMMGIPFPFALSMLGQTGRTRLIPLAWAVNGTMSLFGAALATVIAMGLGFSAVLWLGALVYLGLVLSLGVVSNSTLGG